MGAKGLILKRTYPLLFAAALDLLTGRAGLAQPAPASPAAQLAVVAKPSPVLRPMAGLSPDGAWLAIADGEGRVSVNALNQAQTSRDLLGIAPISTRLNDVSKWLAVGFSPDDRRLAILVQNGQNDIRLFLWDIGQGAAQGYTVPLRTDGLKDLRTPTFSPDGTRLIVGDDRKDDLLIDASNGQVIAHIGRANAHAFSANGQYLIAITSDERAAEIRTVQDGQLVKRLETGADTHDAVFLDDLRIAAFRWNCAVMQASLTEDQAAIHQIIPPDDNCS
jgi:Tol biopolymer transport system component